MTMQLELVNLHDCEILRVELVRNGKDSSLVDEMYGMADVMMLNIFFKGRDKGVTR